MSATTVAKAQEFPRGDANLKALPRDEAISILKGEEGPEMKAYFEKECLDASAQDAHIQHLFKLYLKFTAASLSEAHSKISSINTTSVSQICELKREQVKTDANNTNIDAQVAKLMEKRANTTRNVLEQMRSTLDKMSKALAAEVMVVKPVPVEEKSPEESKSGWKVVGRSGDEKTSIKGVESKEADEQV